MGLIVHNFRGEGLCPGGGEPVLPHPVEYSQATMVQRRTQQRNNIAEYNNEYSIE